jgi:phage gp36-like protein
MVFLTLNDLHVNIRAERLNQIVDEDAAILDDAEASALAMVKDALSSRYDVATIFDQTDRPAQVIRWVRNIMLYDIAGRLPEKVVSERIVKNYDDTLQVLTDIEEGRKSTSLPLLNGNTEGGTSKKSVFRWGSNKARKHS